LGKGKGKEEEEEEKKKKKKKNAPDVNSLLERKEFFFYFP
jgi:hypothetical protein